MVDRWLFFTYTGISRIERKYNNITNKYLYNNIGWNDNTFINPSFFTHNEFVMNGNDNSIIILYDPSFFDLLSGQMKHLTKYSLNYEKITKKFEEKEIYNKSIWFGNHKKIDIHFDWTLTIDNINN